MSDNLIPRQPKRKRQPTAECMREQLALAADEIISLRQRLAVFCDPDAPYQLNVLRRPDPYWGFIVPDEKESFFAATIRRFFRRSV